MTGQDESRWRTVKETAAHFHIGKNQVYEGCRNGWPHRRNGAGVTTPILFDPAEDWPVIADILRPAHVTAALAPQAPSLSRIDRGMRRLQPKPARAA